MREGTGNSSEDSFTQISLAPFFSVICQISSCVHISFERNVMVRWAGWGETGRVDDQDREMLGEMKPNAQDQS